MLIVVNEFPLLNYETLDRLDGEKAKPVKVKEEINKIEFNCLDDVVIFSESNEEMLINLKRIFQRFRQADLKLATAKIRLFVPEINFLGHTISLSKGARVNRDKIEVIKNFPRPKNLKELRRILGMMSF